MSVRPTFTLAVARALELLEFVASLNLADDLHGLEGEFANAAQALLEHEHEWNPEPLPDEPKEPYEDRRDKLAARAQAVIAARLRLGTPMEEHLRRLEDERHADLRTLADWYGFTPLQVDALIKAGA